jgi:ribosomal protein L29
MAEKVKFDELTPDELNNRLNETSDELLQARRKHRMGQFKKTSEFPRLRKEIARIKTHLRARAIKAESAQPAKKRA